MAKFRFFAVWQPFLSSSSFFLFWLLVPTSLSVFTARFTTSLFLDYLASHAAIEFINLSDDPTRMILKFGMMFKGILDIFVSRFVFMVISKSLKKLKTWCDLCVQNASWWGKLCTKSKLWILELVQKANMTTFVYKKHTKAISDFVQEANCPKNCTKCQFSSLDKKQTCVLYKMQHPLIFSLS